MLHRIVLFIPRNQMPSVGDWCMENVNEWALSTYIEDLNINNFIISHLTWEQHKHLYVTNTDEKNCFSIYLSNIDDAKIMKSYWLS